MRLPPPKTIRSYLTPALFPILLAIVVAQLVAAAPTSPLASSEPCQQIHCPVGFAVPDPENGACVCSGPDSFGLLGVYEYLTRLLPARRTIKTQHLRARRADTPASSGPTDRPVTFLPPPKIHTTPALLHGSLSQQPQTLAQISSIQPFFSSSILQLTINLIGYFGPSSMLMNVSTKIPASTIGSNNEPSLVIVPQTITNGSEILTTDFATIMAVNMYSAEYITYWILLSNGTLVSLLSDTSVHDIARMQPGTSGLSIIPSPYTGKKRDTSSASEVDDSSQATSSHHDGNGIFQHAQADASISRRNLDPVNAFNTKMTQEACQNMECTVDNEKPLWNPFTRNCYCESSPTYWAVERSEAVI